MKKILALVFALTLILALFAGCDSSTNGNNSTNNTSQEQTSELEINDDPIVFNGTGDKVVSNVNIPKGTFYAVLSHKGSGNFITDLYYGDGKYDYVSLSNKIGNYEGMSAMTELDGKAVANGTLEVKADGEWAIEFKRVSGTSDKKLSGSGDYISGLIDVTSARNTVKLTHSGSRNFIVDIIQNDGGKYDYESLANKTGEYEGETIANLKAGKKYYISVVADGDWTIEIS